MMPEPDGMPEPEGMPNGDVLVVHCGSSRVTVDRVDADERSSPVLHLDRPLDRGEAVGELSHAIAGEAGEVAAVGHRFVHGGERRRPLLLDDEELVRLWSVAGLAPLHAPHALMGAEVARRALPRVPMVGCFDTEFHQHLDASSSTMPLPESWRTDWGVRRFGFDGCSHQWATEQVTRLLDRPPEDVHAVTVHVGSGVSAAAVTAGHSVDTTTALTPLGGISTTTRSGSLDPGILLHLLTHGVALDQVLDDVQHRSGLLGVSGRSGDLDDLHRAADDGDPRARLAVDVHVRGIAQGIASMAVSLPRLDAVAFTGALGATSARLRAEVCARLAALGVVLDGDRNQGAGCDADLVHAPSSAVAVAVVRSREELVIARAVRRLLRVTSPA